MVLHFINLGSLVQGWGNAQDTLSEQVREEKYRTASYAYDTKSTFFRESLSSLAAFNLEELPATGLADIKKLIRDLSSLSTERVEDLQLFKDNPKALQNLVLITEYSPDPQVKSQSSKLLANIMRNSFSARAMPSNADKINMEKFLKIIEADGEISKSSAAVDFLNTLNAQLGGLHQNLSKFFANLEGGLDANVGKILSEPLKKGLIAGEITTILNDPMKMIETLRLNPNGNSAENKLLHQVLDLGAAVFQSKSSSSLDPAWQQLFKNVISAKTDAQVKKAVDAVQEKMIAAHEACSSHDAKIHNTNNLLSLVQVNLGLSPAKSGEDNKEILFSRIPRANYISLAGDGNKELREILVHDIYTQSQKNEIVWSNISKVLDKVTSPDLDTMINILLPSSQENGTYYSIQGPSGPTGLMIGKFNEQLRSNTNQEVIRLSCSGFERKALTECSDEEKKLFLTEVLKLDRDNPNSKRIQEVQRTNSKICIFDKAFEAVSRDLDKYVDNYPVNSDIQERLEHRLALAKRTLAKEQGIFYGNFVALNETLDKMSIPSYNGDQILNSSSFGEILKARLANLYDGEMIFTKMLADLAKKSEERKVTEPQELKDFQSAKLEQLKAALDPGISIYSDNNQKDIDYISYTIRANQGTCKLISLHNPYAESLLKKYEELEAVKKQDIPHDLSKELGKDHNSQIVKSMIRKTNLEHELEILFLKTISAEKDYSGSATSSCQAWLPSRLSGGLVTLIAEKEKRFTIVTDLVRSIQESLRQGGASISNQKDDTSARRFTEMLGVVQQSLFQSTDRSAENFGENLQKYYEVKNPSTANAVTEEPSMAKKCLIYLMRFISDFVLLKPTHFRMPF